MISEINEETSVEVFFFSFFFWSEHGIKQTCEKPVYHALKWIFISWSLLPAQSWTHIQKWWGSEFETGDVRVLKLSMKVRETPGEPGPALPRWQERNHFPSLACHLFLSTHTHASGHEHEHRYTHSVWLIDAVWVGVEVSCCFPLSTFCSAPTAMSNGHSRALLLFVCVHISVSDGKKETS